MIVAEVGVNIRSYLEEGAGTAGEEIAVYFLERDTGVEVDMFFLDPRFLLYGYRSLTQIGLMNRFGLKKN